MQLICGLAKQEIIQSLKTTTKTAEVLKNAIASKRDETYSTDKNSYPRLINLVLQFPDALQRSSALATRQDLQNKEIHASKTIWVTVAEQFMEGHDSGGIMKPHKKFTRVSDFNHPLSHDQILLFSKAISAPHNRPYSGHNSYNENSSTCIFRIRMSFFLRKIPIFLSSFHLASKGRWEISKILYLLPTVVTQWLNLPRAIWSSGLVVSSCRVLTFLLHCNRV